MPFSEPLSFSPIYQERIWGGRTLEHALGRGLPAGKAIGESWEIVDRPEAQSVVSSGPQRGADLHTLWSQHRKAVFGEDVHASGRFPLLVKILDAREALSVQVHPSGEEAGEPLGEPKNEWWYILEADPDACIYAGFTRALTRAEFEAAVAGGNLESLLHRIPVKAGDSIYVPGGRCHAIGAGCLIAEVQQNSDTTFRVFDWNRTGPDGLPRALHLTESLACMDFTDVAPSLAPALSEAPFSCTFFDLEAVYLDKPSQLPRAGGAMFLVLSGNITVGAQTFSRGRWFVLPVVAAHCSFDPGSAPATLLQVRLPRVTQ
jgi:mannose-6-phosphate isomerase